MCECVCECVVIYCKSRHLKGRFISDRRAVISRACEMIKVLVGSAAEYWTDQISDDSR